MAWPDLALLIVLAAFALNGLYQGMFRQLFSLLGLVLGLTLATLLYRPLGELLTRLVRPASAAQATAYVVILLGIWVAGNLIGFRLRGAARSRQRDWADDVGGTLLGALMGVLMLGVGIAGAAALGLPVGARLAQSRVGAWLMGCTMLLQGLLVGGRY